MISDDNNTLKELLSAILTAILIMILIVMVLIKSAITEPEYSKILITTCKGECKFSDTLHTDINNRYDFLLSSFCKKCGGKLTHKYYIGRKYHNIWELKDEIK